MRLIHKKLLLLLGSALFVLVLAGLIVLLAAWQFGGLPDYGWESGYYAQYNRVKHVIESMPNVRIVDHWQHRDLTLEDFGFTLMVDGTREVTISVHDGSPQMAETRKDMVRKVIQMQIDANQPGTKPSAAGTASRTPS